MRARLIGLGITGAALVVIGLGVYAGQSNQRAACAASEGTPGLLGLPPGPSVQTCNQANLIAGFGAVLAVIGLILLVTGFVLAIVGWVRRAPSSQPAGWYPLPGRPGYVGYWDGSCWRTDSFTALRQPGESPPQS